MTENDPMRNARFKPHRSKRGVGFAAFAQGGLTTYRLESAVGRPEDGESHHTVHDAEAAAGKPPGGPTDTCAKEHIADARSRDRCGAGTEKA
jgi:hypothetical protein